VVRESYSLACLAVSSQIFHIPAPKSHFAHDIEFVKDTAIFCMEKRNMFMAVFLMNANRNEACAMEHIQL
jgi:hypothetical protein